MHSSKFRLENKDFLKSYQNLEGQVDLIICDGPYGVTNFSWDKIKNIQEYNLELLRIFNNLLKPGGTAYIFGKHNALDFIDYTKYLQLNARIIWHLPGKLQQGKKSFTNSYNVIYYVSKGKPKTFNLDDIRVPQMTSEKHRRAVQAVPSVTKGKYRKTQYNPLGKNPGTVWDIKPLTYKSKELISKLHTIQKPIKLIERLILASSNEGDFVLDPYMGTGTVGVVCKMHKRMYCGFDIDKSLVLLSKKRINNYTP